VAAKDTHAYNRIGIIAKVVGSRDVKVFVVGSMNKQVEEIY